MNPLYQMMAQAMPNNNAMGLLQRFQQFRNSFRGNPQEQVQRMLQSGQISNEQYQRAVQMAQQFQGFLK